MIPYKKALPGFLKIGHRGARGLMPENTIPAMEKAIEFGANTIEMDVHVTKDKKVIVYHDACFNPEYTTKADGASIAASERKTFTFYQLNYNEIELFIIGMKNYPAYPQQEKIACNTPLLSELINSVEAYTTSNNFSPVYYLIEIKSNEITDGVEQPAPEEFVKILMDVLDTFKLGERLIVQSFDVRPLQVLHRTHPNVALGFLTEDNKITFEENLQRLGFIPAFYSPLYKMVDEELIQKCRKKSMLVTPWTVNNIHDLKKLIDLKVNGLITDYPNLFSQL